MTKVFMLFTLAILVIKCQPAQDEKALLGEAAKIHNEAVQIEIQIQPQLEQLVQQKNSIQIQGRALSEEEMTFVQLVDGLQASMDWFNKNHVEVPGYEHEHHGQ